MKIHVFYIVYTVQLKQVVQANIMPTIEIHVFFWPTTCKLSMIQSGGPSKPLAKNRKKCFDEAKRDKFSPITSNQVVRAHLLPGTMCCASVPTVISKKLIMTIYDNVGDDEEDDDHVGVSDLHPDQIVVQMSRLRVRSHLGSQVES